MRTFFVIVYTLEDLNLTVYKPFGKAVVSGRALWQSPDQALWQSRRRTIYIGEDIIKIITQNYSLYATPHPVVRPPFAVRPVQVIPSVLVAILFVPEPTATHSPSPYATPRP